MNLFTLAIFISSFFSFGLEAVGVADGPFELDGNAVTSTTTQFDWDQLYSGSVTDGVFTGVVPDPAPMSTFKTGGSKDTNDISSWKHSDSSVPDKDDITNSYASGLLVDGDLVIYFGADRFANDGDAAMGFWFFQDNVQALENGQFSGLHQNGDLLVISNFGSTQEILVYEWLDGELVLLTSNANAMCQQGVDQDACAITNEFDEPSPWPYVPKVGSTSFLDIFPDSSFIEGAVNVGALFADFGSTPCFTSFMAVSRSSTSLTAQLKDFVLGSFQVCEIDLTLECLNGTISQDYTDIVYDYELVVTNNGLGTLYNITVDYGDTTVATYLSLDSGDSQTIQGSFSSLELSPETLSASLQASLVPGSTDPDEQLVSSVLPDTCPSVPVSTSMNALVSCLNVSISEAQDSFLYDYWVTIYNTGFGNQTVTDLTVSYNGSVVVLDSGIGQVLMPFDDLDFFGTFSHPSQVANLTVDLESTNYKGQTETVNSVSNSCPPFNPVLGLQLTGSCQSYLLSEGDKLVVQAAYSGEVCNTGEINFNPTDVSVDLGTPDNTLDDHSYQFPLNNQDCQQFNGTFFPTDSLDTQLFAPDLFVNTTLYASAQAVLALGQLNSDLDLDCPFCF